LILIIQFEARLQSGLSSQYLFGIVVRHGRRTSKALQG
jgi:hypothetical protein